MNFDLNLRDLQQEMDGTQTFESLEAAKAWLKDRPKFIQVMGVASRHVPREVGDALRECMRPLDEDELRLKEESAAKAEEAARERSKAMCQADAERHRQELAAADPNRPLDVSYSYDAEMSLADTADEREITAEAREAVLAWVKERNTWVERRGQIVGGANIKVWPGPIPEGEGDERVIMGDFIPVASSAETD